ncbi:membrane-associated or secreted protein,Ulp1 protease family, C-terminal catalytic domain [Trichonephila clavata]|uniref:Membrane-associated or secreted protein,Ulp1 protease family, C-terminal catalytic domain n=1 Tax=Trichonephila clavata TaxID=2740835 RepID=A0A8X6GYL9_TRICU|nr:membrane-associated or secreted protein,Ulp1 protease family, C-terminal catalytic domain [Trichonephila clavata]
MLGTTKENTYFTKLKAGGRFAIYAFGIYLAATLAVGCLGLMIGFPLLTFPLAILISHPVIWIIMGVVLTAAYKLAKNYIDGKRASQGEQKTQDGDSGIVPGSEPNSRNSSRRSSLDSGLGGKEFHEDLQTLVHQTNRKNYTYWLDDNDITHIARVVYGYSQSEYSNNNVYFLAPSYSNGWDELTKEFLQNYRGELKQNSKLIFTSVLHINNNHWVTLVIKPDAGDKKFRVYYCNSFGNQLPDNVLNIVKGELLKEQWSLDIASSKVNQQSDGHNCGIFALENAHKITQMLNEDKSFDEINKKLSEYKFDLNEKREEFTRALMNDEKWRNANERAKVVTSTPPSRTESVSPLQSVSSYCSIM